MRRYRLGKILGSLVEANDRARKLRSAGSFLELTDEELCTHMLVLGTTGGGKSRFLRQLWREHLRNGRGCCIVEPGDLIEDILADVAYDAMTSGDRSLLKRIHVVELSPFQLVRYDPFAFTLPPNVHPELRHVIYRAWQHTRVQGHAEIYQWKQNQSTDFEGMPNLQRNFINVLTAASTLVGGRRLSAADAEILVDLQHPDHDRVFERLRPQLDRDVLADFEILHSYRNVRDLRNDVGSLINRFRSTHGPLFRETISGDGQEPSLSIRDIVRRGEFLFVKTKKTRYASNDQNNALAGMMIHDVVEHAFEERRQFTLIIDEAHKYVRPGIGDVARTGRKFGFSLVLATPDLASMKKGDTDLGRELLNVVNVIAAFRMTEPEDTAKLAAFLYAQNLDFTELTHEVERRGGPEWIQVDDWSETRSRQQSSTVSSGTTATNGTSFQETNGIGTKQSGTAAFDALGRPTGGSRGNGTTVNHGTSNGRQTSSAAQSGVANAEGESFGITINHKLVHLEKILREVQRTGMLETSVKDQLAKFAQILSGHTRRRATVRVREGKAVHIETLDVEDRFRSPEARTRAIEWITRELIRTHDYYFTPTLDPDEQRRRIDAFVQGASARASDVPENEETAMEGNPLL